MTDPRFSIEDIRTCITRASERGLSADVKDRLSWFLHFAEHRSVSQTCRHFGIARTTFYRWAYRFDPADLSTLADASRNVPATSIVTEQAPAAPVQFVQAAPVTPVASPELTPHDAAGCAGCERRERIKIRRRAVRGFFATAYMVGSIAILVAMIGMALTEGGRDLQADSTPAASTALTVRDPRTGNVIPVALPGFLRSNDSIVISNTDTWLPEGASDSSVRADAAVVPMPAGASGALSATADSASLHNCSLLQTARDGSRRWNCDLRITHE